MHDRELKLFSRALGDVSRLGIVRRLASEAEVSVTDLAEWLSLSQPLASWHLRILKRAGMLTTRKNGRQVYCSLDRRRFAQFQAALAELILPGPAQSNPASPEGLGPGLRSETTAILAD